MCKWIKYSEQKPTESGKYIVLNYSGTVLIREYKKYWAERGIDGFGRYTHALSQIAPSTVLYWMELPKISDQMLQEIDDKSVKEMVYKAKVKQLQKQVDELECRLKSVTQDQ